MLVDILEGLPSKPHETSYLVAECRNHYEYLAAAWAQITMERIGEIEYMSEAKVESGKEFDTLHDILDSSMNCAGMGSKPRQLLAKFNNELIGNDKVKVD